MSTSNQPEIAVVIATHNRPADLERCVAALHAQRGAPRFEIVIVDDGGKPPVSAGLLTGSAPVRVLRADGIGPAGARNLGLRGLSAGIVLFTDDDTTPAADWVAAASERLRTHPAEVAVEGPIVTRPYDRLRAHSVASDRAGHYWTCNIGYRRWVLEALGGFDDHAFPYSCEDRDLGFRALALGPIGFAPSMWVSHMPRDQSIMALIRHGLWVPSQIKLARRHQALVPRSRIPLPRPLDAIVGHIRTWQKRWRSERVVLFSDPRRLVRFVTIACGQICLTIAMAVKVMLDDARELRLGRRR